MIKLVKDRDYISVSDINSFTNNGYDIYIRYVGRVGLMNRPWGSKEKKLSFGIFEESGVWLWKDLAREESGNAIQFVQRLFGLNFVQALDKIAGDFNLSSLKINVSPVVENYKKKDKVYADIKFSISPFSSKDEDFWGCVGVSESYFNSFNYWKVKECVLNNKRIPINKDERVYAYYAEDIDKVKIYFPDRDKIRFISNIPHSYIWNFPKERIDKLYICKSNKDMLVTSLINKNVCCTQSESVSIFSKEIISKINTISPNPIIFYGSDRDGMEKSEEISSITGWNRIYTPTDLLPINDSYGYVKEYGKNKLQQLLWQN